MSVCRPGSHYFIFKSLFKELKKSSNFKIKVHRIRSIFYFYKSSLLFNLRRQFGKANPHKKVPFGRVKVKIACYGYNQTVEQGI